MPIRSAVNYLTLTSIATIFRVDSTVTKNLNKNYRVGEVIEREN